MVIRVHTHATEEESRVLYCLRNILPSSVEVVKANTKGHHGNPISVFEARIDQRKVLKGVWQCIFSRLPSAELNRLIQTTPEKVDDNCFFYLRFDKPAANNGSLVLTDIGDAVRLMFKILSFPAKREVAVPLVEKFLEEHRIHEA